MSERKERGHFDQRLRFSAERRFFVRLTLVPWLPGRGCSQLDEVKARSALWFKQGFYPVRKTAIHWQTELAFHTLVRKDLSVGWLRVTREIAIFIRDRRMLNAEIEQREFSSLANLHPPRDRGGVMSPGCLQEALNHVLEFASREKWKACEIFPCQSPPSNGTRGTWGGGKKTFLFQPEDLFIRADFPLCM